MDEGRLAAVRKRTNHNRKSVIVMNDIIKNRQEVYRNYLNKEQHGFQSKTVAGEMGLKRNIVRNNVLMQCLEARKEKMLTKNPTLPLGKYGGRPIHTFSRDIESMIAWMHPRLRRLRKVEKMKENGLRLGAIIDPSSVPARIDEVFGPGGQRSNSDSRILVGNPNSNRRKSSNRNNRRVSRTAGQPPDPFAQQQQQQLQQHQNINRRRFGRVEAPSFRAFDESSSLSLGKEATTASQGVDRTDGTDSSILSSSTKRNTHVEPIPSTSNPRRDNNHHPSSELPHPAVLPRITIGSNDHGNSNSRRNTNNTTTIIKHTDKKSATNSNNSSVKPEVGPVEKLTRRPTLILPPIQTTKDLVKKK